MAKFFSQRHRRPFAVGAVLGVVLVAVVFQLPDPFNRGRPRSVWYRFECVLEDWNVIPYDFGRHIDG